MEIFDQIAKWISENESLFSGLAAIVALVAIVPAALRPMLRRRAAHTEAEPRESDATGRESLPPDSTSNPRLAVLPIEVSGTGDTLRTAAEVMTAELTTLLARNRGCEVISRRSATAFANGGGTTGDAGRTLDVRYVVEGQLSSARSGLRIGASLVDTSRDEVVWSDAFEIDSDDFAGVAQSLAERVAAHLGIELIRAEVGRAKRQPSDREARDLFLGAHGVLFTEGHNKESYARAIDLLSQAIARDPEYADAHGLLALLVGLGNVFGFFDSEADARERSLAACRRAIEIDDQSSDVLGYVGCAYCDLQLYDQGVALLERAIELNPSNAQAKAALGTAFIGQGRLEDGAAKIEEALRLTPAYKGIAPWATVLAGAYLRLGRLDDAATSIDQALRCDPSFFPTQLSAAMLAVLRSDPETAARHTHEAKRINPNLALETVEQLVGHNAAGQLAGWLDEKPLNG